MSELELLQQIDRHLTMMGWMLIGYCMFVLICGICLAEIIQILKRGKS